MKVASISELKDSLSAHLDWVRAGEVVVVTDRRVPVACLERIGPSTPTADELGLVAAGIVAPRKQRLDAEAFFALPKGDCAGGLTAALIEDRELDR